MEKFDLSSEEEIMVVLLPMQHQQQQYPLDETWAMTCSNVSKASLGLLDVGQVPMNVCLLVSVIGTI
jgi:hypothetical protein